MAMHFCTVPNQKTWDDYSLFKSKPSNLFSLPVNAIAHLFPWILYTGCLYGNELHLRSAYVCFHMSPGKCTQITLRTFFHTNSNSILPLDHSRDLQLIHLFSLLMFEKNRIEDKSLICYVSGPSLWNSLPRNIRDTCTLTIFKKVLTAHS